MIISRQSRNRERNTMDETKASTFPIFLSGNEYRLRFDLDAQMSTVSTAKMLNPMQQNITWWRFLDAPYDISDMAAMLMHGINGAKREQGDKNFLTLDDIKVVLEHHFAYISELAEDIDDETKAMKFSQDENQKVFSALQDATRAGSGFRVGKGRRKKDLMKKVPKAAVAVENFPSSSP
jgi:hypothetical protein